MDDYEEDVILLKQWGTIYRKTVKWHPKDGTYCSVTGVKSRTALEAENSAWSAAVRAGYVAPKWWQWWRWSEEKPPAWLRANPA